jgi:hypothetical protein
MTKVVLYLTIVLMGLLIGGLGLLLKTAILIITTAVGGAWLGFKCIGIAIGNYPDEFTVAKSIRYGKFDGVPIAFYVYMSLTLLTSIGGIVYQYRMYKDSKDIEELEAESGYKRV